MIFVSSTIKLVVLPYNFTTIIGTHSGVLPKLYNIDPWIGKGGWGSFTIDHRIIY